MRKFFTFFCLSLFLQSYGQQRPKLVIGVVVDQMKAEYLDRFYDDYSQEGFKRLMNEGYSFHNMNYNYVPTYTAPGHASIYTGATPATHGIIGNDWYIRETGKNKYCTDDASVKTLVIGAEKEGMMSPKNLLATTVTDELRMATNFRGKVIGLSIKDRGAILPAGHFANWAFWYSKSGDFISSSFYGEKMPDWVTKFNSEKHYMPYIEKGWSLLKPIDNYNESLSDDNPYEGRIDKTKPPVFPYDLNKLYKESGADILRTTPFGNDLLADLALKTIENEGLGKDNITDFLTVSFSSTDYIGHTFGPRSIEIQDTYLRLDLTLARMLTYLDKNIGKDNYLLFLTADHAAAENPIFLRDNKYDVTNVPSKETLRALEKFSIDTYGANLILNYSNFNIYLNRDMVKAKGLELTSVKNTFKSFVLGFSSIKRVYTDDEVLASSGGDYYLDFIFRGFDPKQNGDLVLVHKTGYMEYNETGTTHGTPNSYDTNVPLLFYGWHIAKGESYKKENITSIAPTLSKLLKITFPNGTEGQVLEELLKTR
ncbi:Predicted pyrophosphatase or phosphodiesterase, AlkP superfamily [Flavobacterium succinicans]|uniref:Predicted pyrophosphatase or phosphodiesterase, AlkP superfamily n=1 Tax=Flavobacterium succinicans TaxID=29536 RepID=A0A1I4ZPS1_9FLAO|nr:alkaline phosphatase PafA [Flavobacterium succinicans]SFN52254.1 Predicted pyrophosphatase or phosphodiesterase, AlkP superfamily [Flavobacterium succinicans]